MRSQGQNPQQCNQAHEGIELEADPGHAEIVMKEVGLASAKPSRIQIAKIRDKITDETEMGGHKLELDEARQYRTIATKLNYLAIDKIDIQFVVKEFAWAMNSPKQSH